MTDSDADDRSGHANAGFRRLFGDDGLTVGLGFPLTGERRGTPDCFSISAPVVSGSNRPSGLSNTGDRRSPAAST